MLKKLLILTLIISCTSTIFAQDDYKGKWNAAYKLYRARKYAEAIPAFVKLGERDDISPQNKNSCYLHAGYSARNIKKYNEAAAFARKAGQVKNPYGYESKTREIEFMHNGKKYKEITETITADEIMEWPKYYRSNALHYLGLAQYSLKNGEDAEKTFRLMHENAVTSYHKGLASLRSANNYRHRIKDEGKALAAYHAIIKNPKNKPDHKAEACDALASMLISKKKNDEALAEYDKLVAIKKISPYWKGRGLYNKGNLLVKMGKKEEAAKCYKQSLAVKGSAGWVKKGCNSQLKKLQAK